MVRGGDAYVSHFDFEYFQSGSHPALVTSDVDTSAIYCVIITRSCDGGL